MFDWFPFRSLNCGRIKMHKNLFLAMASNNVIWIIWYAILVHQPLVGRENPVSTKRDHGNHRLYSAKYNGLKAHVMNDCYLLLTCQQVWCRGLHVVKNYFMLSTYTWMLGEGAYLQLLLMNTWRVTRCQIWTIVVCCWTLPLVSLIPYTLSRLSDDKENVKYEYQ